MIRYIMLVAFSCCFMISLFLCDIFQSKLLFAIIVITSLVVLVCVELSYVVERKIVAHITKNKAIVVDKADK